MINILLVIVSFAVGVALFMLRHEQEGKREKVLLFMSFVSVVLYVIYRIFSIQYDNAIKAQTVIYNAIMALPLQLCYLCIVFIPIAILTKKRILFAACYLLSPIGGMMAILFPDAAFNDRTILDPTLFTFLMLHCLLAILGIGLASTGLYTPCYKDVLKLFLVMLPTLAVIHIFNLVFLKIGGFSNFMYTMSPANNALLELSYKLLPKQLLYLIFPILVFTLLAVIRVFLFKCVMRVLSKRKTNDICFTKSEQ